MWRIDAIRALGLICLAAALLPAVAWAGGDQMFGEFGVSPRDTAMGNAFAGLANDYTATYYNPAGLAYVQGHHVDMGYRGVYPNLYLHFTRTPKGNLAGGPDTDFFLLGVASDLEFSEMINPRVSERVAAGLALAVSSYLKSFTLYAEPNAPYFFRYRDRPVSLLSLYAGFSVKIFDWFSFGGSINAAPSETYTDVISHSKYHVPAMYTETKTGMASVSWSKIEPVLGTMFHVPAKGRSDYLGIGLVWRNEVTTVDGSGELTTQITAVLDDTGQTFEAPVETMAMHQLTGFAPMMVTLGTCWRPTERISVTADAIWQRWSRWLMGNEDYPTPRFNDTVHARAGSEQRFAIDWSWVEEVTARAGYYYEPSPVGDMNGYLNILDPDKHVGAVGTGFKFADPLGVFVAPVRVDVAYQLHYLIDGRLSNERDSVYGPIEYGGQIHTFAGTVAVDF